MPSDDFNGNKARYRRGLATIYDVAREAEVSSQTVSRYFNGYLGIRPTTREKVERAAAALNYRPNLTARLLATNVSRRIGAFTPEIAAVGGGSILVGASRGASDAGYLLDIVSLDVRDPGSIGRAIESIGQHELAGIVAFAPTDAVVDAFASADFAVPVVIDSDHDDRRAGFPRSPDGASEMIAVDYLVGLGHRSFGHVAGPDGWVSARNRLLGFESGLERHGLTSRMTVFGDWSTESGYAAGVRFARSDVTAIVVASDQMAFGVLRALRDEGVSVPDDVSVVGFDDLAEASYFSPSLTSLRQDFEAHGRAAVYELIELIHSGKPRSSPPPQALELIIRESTAPVAGR